MVVVSCNNVLAFQCCDACDDADDARASSVSSALPRTPVLRSVVLVEAKELLIALERGVRAGGMCSEY